ncbi:uncharacterized protein TNCT_98511 [Trichonephila clavata]|uniref:Uncharacterized protein n=1 Tax=Trichonephila clavata TaxID=2740835 RepID=A0A8X6GNF7_TRICU|nr:uncharacterized protein TNCT_98511 [Trichonephila clavata]
MFSIPFPTDGIHIPSALPQRHFNQFSPNLMNESLLKNNWIPKQHIFHPYPERPLHHTYQFMYPQKSLDSRLDDRWKGYYYNPRIFFKSPANFRDYERGYFAQKHEECHSLSRNRLDLQVPGSNEMPCINDKRQRTQDDENVSKITRKEFNTSLKRRIENSEFYEKNGENFSNKMTKMEDMRILESNAENCNTLNNKYSIPEEFEHSVNISKRHISDIQEEEKRETSCVSQLPVRQIYSLNTPLRARTIYSNSFQPLTRSIYSHNPHPIFRKNYPNNAELTTSSYSNSPELVTRSPGSSNLQLKANSTYSCSPQMEIKEKHPNVILATRPIYSNNPQSVTKSVYSSNPKSDAGLFYSNSSNSQAGFIYLNSELGFSYSNSQQLAERELYSNSSNFEARQINSISPQLATQPSYLRRPQMAKRESTFLTMKPILSYKTHIHPNCEESDEKLKTILDAHKEKIFLELHANSGMNDSRRDSINPSETKTNIVEHSTMFDQESFQKNYFKNREIISNHPSQASNLINSLETVPKINLSLSKLPDSFKTSPEPMTRPQNYQIFRTKNKALEEKEINFVSRCLNTVKNEGNENSIENPNMHHMIKCSTENKIKKLENIKQENINSSSLETRLRSVPAPITAIVNKNSSNNSSDDNSEIYLKECPTVNSHRKQLVDVANKSEPTYKMLNFQTSQKQAELYPNNILQSSPPYLERNNNKPFVKTIYKIHQRKILPKPSLKDLIIPNIPKSAESAHKNESLPSQSSLQNNKHTFYSPTQQSEKKIHNGDLIFSKLVNDNNFSSTNQKSDGAGLNGKLNFCKLLVKRPTSNFPPSSSQESNDAVGNSKVSLSEFGIQNHGLFDVFNKKIQNGKTETPYLGIKNSSPTNTMNIDDRKESQKFIAKRTNCSNSLLSPIPSHTITTVEFQEKNSPILNEKCVTKGKNCAVEDENNISTKRMESPIKNKRLLKNKKSILRVVENLPQRTEAKEQTMTGYTMMQIPKEENRKDKEGIKRNEPIIEHLKKKDSKTLDPAAEKRNKDILKWIAALQTTVLELKVAKRNLSMNISRQKEIQEENLISEFENEVFLAVFREV